MMRASAPLRFISGGSTARDVLNAAVAICFGRYPMKELQTMERARVTLGRIGPGLFLSRNLESPSGASSRDLTNSEASGEGDSRAELALATGADEPLEV